MSFVLDVMSVAGAFAGSVLVAILTWQAIRTDGRLDELEKFKAETENRDRQAMRAGGRSKASH